MARGSHMTQRYGGLQGGFAESIRDFAEKAKDALDATYKDIVIEVGIRLILTSPVGQPEIWQVNKIAHAYNMEVLSHNSQLRNDPANLTKAGRLKPGKRLNDGMDIKAPDGYVGGRFRGNWQFSIDAPAHGDLDRVDPEGTQAIAELRAQVEALSIGQTAYLVNNLPYAIPLEYGHSSQTPPNGMVRTTVADFRRIMEDAAKENRV